MVMKFWPFAKKTAAPQQSGSVITYSSLYGMNDLSRYNPDDLIGRQGFQIYKRMMKDEQIKAAVRFRRDSTTSRDWAFIYDEESDLSDDEKLLRIKIMTRALLACDGSLKKYLDGVMSSIQHGFSVSEKLFRPFSFHGATYWGLRAMRLKPFDTFFPEIDEYGELIALRQCVDGKEIDIPLDRVIHHAHNAEEHVFFGQSELREAYRSWWSKDVLIKLENIFLERSAGGFIWAKSTGNMQANSQEFLAMQQALSSVQTKTSMFVPSNIDLHVEQPKDTQAFDRAIKKHDRAMAKALLMPNLLGLTDQGDTGSYSQSQTQMEAYLWMLDSEAAELEETINEQLIKHLCELNFGDDEFPRFTFKPLSDSMAHRAAEVWSNLVAKNAVTKTETDEKYLRELLGMPPMGESKIDGAEESAGSDESVEIDEAVEDHEESNDYPDNKKAFSRAQNRVDFAVIDRSTIVQQWQSERALSDVMKQLIEYVKKQIEEHRETVDSAEEIQAFKIPSSILAALKAAGGKVLKAGWSIGIDNAVNEIEKAGRAKMPVDEKKMFSSVADQSAAWIKAKEFAMAGKLSSDALFIVQNILFNGLKMSKGTKEVIDDIYETFAKKGMLDRETAEEALGYALDIVNPSARLETVVRTNMFEAINEARFGYFTDPELKGFVTALEYSAILDGRTTDICEHLDGRVYRASDDVWDRFRPPNHFNCRSILIPITVTDDVEITRDLPTMQPQEGFK